MGILNTTPDSFYSESRVNEWEVLDKAVKMVNEGATILDIGGQSTRPGSKPIAETEELDRVLPAFIAIRKELPNVWLSIDTYYAKVAQLAVESGADIINDISAGDDDAQMLELVSQLKVPYIAMHKKGLPANMQSNPEYKNVLQEVLEYFVKKSAQLSHLGINDWILDPGFGFGKNLEHNFTLLKNIETFGMLNRPIMVGISRKGMIQKTLQVTAERALNGTTALNMLALSKGANILRVHDVSEAAECVKLWQHLSEVGA